MVTNTANGAAKASAMDLSFASLYSPARKSQVSATFPIVTADPVNLDLMILPKNSILDIGSHANCAVCSPMWLFGLCNRQLTLTFRWVVEWRHA
ncbi:MAG: hypothetical protein CMJ78_03010 [Planctomycetaceae bacterium]|nr:hypothetical protein [Planctomycetaceae bacterium]